MDALKLRLLAGLSTDRAVMEKSKRVAESEADHCQPKAGTFEKKARVIYRELIKVSGGDIDKAIKKLDKYCRDAGADCANKEEIAKARDMLQSILKTESINFTRRLAGLPIIEAKDEDEDEDEDERDGEDKDEENEEELPKIVEKMADDLLKNGMPEKDDLTTLIMKVYDAGFRDGQKEAKEEGDDTDVAPDSKESQKQ